MLVVGDVADHLLAIALVGPQPLLAPVGVARDHGVGRRQDPLRGAVVLLQHDRVGVGEVLLELDDVADVGAAEGVDRLIGVADDAQLSGGHAGRRGRHQLADQRVLRVVGVLVLVDQHVPEPAPVVLGDIRQPLQQRHRLHDQVIEVERVGRAQPRLVDRVDLGDLPLVPQRRALHGVVGREQLVLEVRDLGGDGPRRELLRIQLEIAGDEPDQAARVVGVVDGEGAAHPEVLGLPAQDPHAHRVERGHPHRVGPAPDQRIDPGLHLGRGLVGERDRHDLAGVHVPLGQQPADAVGEHARLPRTRSRDDQQRRARVRDGLALTGVEPFQQRRATLGGGLDDIIDGKFEKSAHRGNRVPPLPDRARVWHTAGMLDRRRFFYGYRTPVPVAS